MANKNQKDVTKKNLKSQKVQKKEKTVKKEVVDTKKKVVKKEKEIPNEVITDTTFDSSNTHKRGIYISYSFRILFSIITVFLFLSLGTYFLLKTIYMESGKMISYTEKSNVEYNVCLKNNDFYEEKCLPKNMKYVASLIDNIQVEFNYLFNIDEDKDIEFNYDITGKLVIKDKDGKSFYEKDYVLLKDKVAKISGKEGKINELLTINYDDFNSRANSFKSSYYVEAESYLIVTMNIKKNTINSLDKFSIANDSEMHLTIPLSEKAVDVELNYVELNKKSDIISKEKLALKNGLYIVFAGICIFFGLYIMIKTMRKYRRNNNSKVYDNYVKKILREYDRLIAESRTIVSFEDKEIIKVSNFDELLDIHDNLTLPIMYYNVTSHIKCYFYIVHQNIVYLYTVKASDLEKKS